MRVGEVAQWLNRLLCKCKDNVLDPQHPCRSQMGIVAHLWPTPQEAEMGSLEQATSQTSYINKLWIQVVEFGEQLLV